jgi:NADH-quinone oxidoreductase subunit E
VNALIQKHADEIREIMAKYPADQAGKRSAVMPLMYLAQHDDGYVTRDAIRDIAELCEISGTEVASIIGFYSLYYDQPSGEYRVQVCTDLPCALRGADQFLEKLCENLGITVGETTPDGKVKVEAVMCLAGCDKAPMFQVQSSQGLEYHENQTVESALEVISKLRQG